MVATITNRIVDSFVLCKHKAYLELLDSSELPTQYELQLKAITAQMLVDFRESVKKTSTSAYDISRIEPKDVLDLSTPALLLCPSFSFQDRYALNIDAFAINPPAINARELKLTPITVSPHHKITKRDRISLCLKTLLLLELNPSIEATHGRFVYGRNRLVTTFSFQSHMRESRDMLRQIKQLVEHPQEPRHFKNNHCKVCTFESRCHREFVEKDNLSMLGSIPQKQIAGLNNHGIFTVTQLSYTFRPRPTKKHLKPDTRPQFALKALALREKTTYIIDPPNLPSTPIEVFVDFEGIPNEHFVYLAGFIVLQGGSERRESLWADSPDEADSLMENFLARLADVGHFTMYHYGTFEVQALQAFNKRTQYVHADQVTAVIANSINLLPLLSLNVYPPTYSNDLKSIAAFLGFRWSDEGMTGAKSVVLRHLWELTGDAEHKNTLVRYNSDDCSAVKVTKEWLAKVGTHLTVTTDNGTEVRAVAGVQATSYHKWGKPRFVSAELDAINKCAYFDYQRSKVYLRTSKAVRSALVRERGARSEVNKIDKRLMVPDSCPKCGGHQVVTASTRLRRRRILDLKFMRNGVKKWVVEVRGRHFRCLTCSTIFECSMYGRNLLVWSMNQHVTYRVGLERVGQMLLETFNIRVPNAAEPQPKRMSKNGVLPAKWCC